MRGFRQCAIAVCMMFSCFSALCQNIFDARNSKEYGEYLFLNGDYTRAVQEFSRAVFFDAKDTTSWKKLVLCANEQGDYRLSFEYLSRFENEKIFPLPTIRRWQNFVTFYSKNGGDKNLNFNVETDGEKFSLNTLYNIRQNEWKKAQQMSAEPHPNGINQEVSSILIQFGQEKQKHLLLAGAMSAVIPGSGKIYTGRWKDGLFSMLLFGSSFWQSYRGFSKDGLKSPVGWLFGGLCLGFYSGNVYGSVKSAREYNQLNCEKYHNQIDHWVDTHYGIH